MKANFKSILVVCLLLVSPIVFAQTSGYQFKRLIKPFKGTWKRISLPSTIYGHIRPDLADLRVIGITPNNDTLTVPYKISSPVEKVKTQTVVNKLISQTQRHGINYYTFEVGAGQVVNQLVLHFAEQNFDRTVRLEGSNDQAEWFTVLDSASILAIKNAHIAHSFTTLLFDNAQYRYYRVKLLGVPKLQLRSATFELQQIQEGYFVQYHIKLQDRRIDTVNKLSIVDITLKQAAPVSFIGLTMPDSLDFYRRMNISYVADSVRTSKGWQYNYVKLIDTVVSSLEKSQYKFPNVITNKLRVQIYNHDQEPLSFGLAVMGNPYELLVRFPEQQATYYLVYDNPLASKATYDLAHFEQKIPADVLEVELGEEQNLNAPAEPEQPLSKNKAWLWSIMAVLIILIFWFVGRLLLPKA